jgi:signal peptidase II
LSRAAAGIPWLWTPVVLLVDFVAKRLVLAHADRLAQPVEVIGELARFTYVRNPGAAMGLVIGGRPLLIGISVVAAAALILLYRHTSRRLVVRRCAVSAILGGALGNLVDRVFYDGLVVDFIDLGVGAHRFYTFNVADMGVTLGGLVLFLSLWREGRGGRETARGDRDEAVTTAPAVGDDL